MNENLDRCLVFGIKLIKLDNNLTYLIKLTIYINISDNLNYSKLI